MVYCVTRELTVDWFNARPFDREAKGVQSKLDQQIEILFVTVPRIAGVAAFIDSNRVRRALESPPIGIGAATFDLVRGC